MLQAMESQRVGYDLVTDHHHQQTISLFFMSVTLFLLICEISPPKKERKKKKEWTSLVAQMVKNLPAIQETWFQSLSQEFALEKEMATHSCILAWKIPWTEEPGRLPSMGWQRFGHD